MVFTVANKFDPEPPRSSLPLFWEGSPRMRPPAQAGGIASQQLSKRYCSGFNERSNCPRSSILFPRER